MAVLKGKKAFWLKLSTPEKKYMSEETQWSIVLHLSDKESRTMLKKKLITKERFNDDDVPFVKVTRSTHWKKSGDEKTPVKVVDMYGQDLDPRSVGNGSTVNVQYSVRDWDFNGQKGKSMELVAVQVVELIEYTGGTSSSGGSEFDFLSRDEVTLDDDLDLDDDVFE